jgi:nicotinamide mononucleotide transporter
MNEVWQNIRNGFATAALLDQLNLALGVLGVWLMIRRTLWAFPVGLLAVSVQGVLFFQARFYADSLLQVFFFVSLAWGWRHWVRDRGAAPELPVTILSWRGRAVTVALAGVAVVAWALALQRWTDARMPWRDAFIAAFSVAGQVLQARKVLENWALWTVVNAVAVASYWQADLAYSAFLYAIYLVLGIAGGVAWWRAWQRQNRDV